MFKNSRSAQETPVPNPSQPYRNEWDVRSWLGKVFLVFLGLLIATTPALTQTPLVVKLTIHDTIQPITADYLKRGLDDAASRHAAAVLISMGTPGGLLDSTREMVADIEACLLYTSRCV